MDRRRKVKHKATVRGVAACPTWFRQVVDLAATEKASGHGKAYDLTQPGTKNHFPRLYGNFLEIPFMSDLAKPSEELPRLPDS